VFSSYSEGALGPDGLCFLFYQKFWDVIKDDLMVLLKGLQKGSLDLFRINFATLTLIPKVENAFGMKNFRPISLLNCSFKIFGRMLTSRLEKICERLVAQEQSAFIRGRYILVLLWLMKLFIAYIKIKNLESLLSLIMKRHTIESI
jgi:hypothetical protein